MANSEKLSLKLVVDTEKKRVVFAECDKDFADILFSFLTLPIGTIIRRMNKKSSPLGCFKTLYESIEKLDKGCFETEACKNMLMQPRSAYAEICEDLKLNVDELKPRRYYRCTDWDCYIRLSTRVHSLVPGARCRCGKTMSEILEKVKSTSVEDTGDGVFVKGGAKRIMVSDDFQVLTACTANIQALLNKLGIIDGTILEEKDVEVGMKEMLTLLEIALRSKTPLSEMFLEEKQLTESDVEIPKEKGQSEIKAENDTTKIDLKLVVNKDNEEVLYAEANHDFVNLLFSFLTFPLGSLVKLFNGCSSLKNIDNLYSSVNNEFIKSDECKAMLTSPKLAPLFGIDKQVMKIDEVPPTSLSYSRYKISTNPVNPKLRDYGTKSGGRFIRAPERFMVTPDLEVTPISAAAVIKLTKKLHVPITSIEDRNISCDETEALNLLKACLVSHNALGSAFSARKRRSKKYFAQFI